MVKNDLLENRLNNYRSGKPVDTPQENETLQTENTVQPKILNNDLFASALDLFVTLGKIPLYGYCFKLCFNTQWNLFQFTCIGLGFTFLLEFIRQMKTSKL